MPKLVLGPEVLSALPSGVGADSVVAQARLSTGVTARFGETHLLRTSDGALVVLTRASSFESFASVALDTGAAPRLERRGFDTVLVLATADGAEHSLDVGAFARDDVEQVLGSAPATASTPADAATSTRTPASATASASVSAAAFAPKPALLRASTTAPTLTRAPATVAVPAPMTARVAASTPARTPGPATSSASAPAASEPARGGGLLTSVGLTFLVMSTLVPSGKLGVLVAIAGLIALLRGASLLSSAAKARANTLGVRVVESPSETTRTELSRDSEDSEDSENSEDTPVTGNSDLRDAVEDGDLERMRRLLEAGADPCEQDEDGASLLACAADSGLDHEVATSAAELLLSYGAKVDSADESGNTPLMLATMNEDVPMMRLLLDRGANLEARDEDGSTPLRVAIEVNADESAALFLLTRGADPSTTDDDGRTALEAAKDNERQQVLDALRALGIQ